jgi:hypothetical protein
VEAGFIGIEDVAVSTEIEETRKKVLMLLENEKKPPTPGSVAVISRA